MPLSAIAETARLLEPALVVLTATTAADALAAAGRTRGGRRARRRSRSRAPGTSASVAESVGARYLEDDPVTAGGLVARRLRASDASPPTRRAGTRRSACPPPGAVPFEQLVHRPGRSSSTPRRARSHSRDRYWQEVEVTTRASCAPRSATGGIALRLFGRLTLLRFGAPETAVDDAGALSASRSPAACSRARPAARSASRRRRPTPSSCARRSTGSSRASAGRPGAPLWTGALYRHVQRRLHTEHQPPLLPAPDRRGAHMKVVVFGATGTIGQALVPVLAREHDVVAVSRQPREPGADGVAWAQADATDAARCAPRSRVPTSPTTSSTRSARSDFEERDRVAAETVAARGRGRRRAAARSTSAVSATTRPSSRPTCAAAARPATRARIGQRAGDDAARRDGGRRGERRVRDDPRARRPAARR